MNLTREQLLRQFELSAVEHVGTMHVLKAWPEGKPNAEPKLRQCLEPSDGHLSSRTGERIEITCTSAAWYGKCLRSTFLPGWQYEHHYKRTFGELELPRTKEAILREHVACLRYRELASLAAQLPVAFDASLNGEVNPSVRWTLHLHMICKPQRVVVGEGWYELIPDLFLASVVALTTSKFQDATNTAIDLSLVDKLRRRIQRSPQGRSTKRSALRKDIGARNEKVTVALNHLKELGEYDG